MQLYHGSIHKIPSPTYGLGNHKNDYGLGFYCTAHYDLAAEWACSKEHNGFVNEYDLDTTSLTRFSLTDSQYHILNWLAVLLENRTFSLNSPIKKEGYKFLLTNFLPEYASADIIIGYRADDSYFSFANAFLSNEISLSQLNSAMKLGDLGEQLVLKSANAFKQLKYVNSYSVSKQIYYPKRLKRDRTARENFSTMRNEQVTNGLFLIDIMRCNRGELNELIRRELSK